MWQLWKAFSTFRWFCGFVVQRESAESKETFKFWRFFVFLYWSLKVTALERQIINNECLRGNAARINQLVSILDHVTPVVIFQVKSWPYSTFYCFVHWDLVSTLLKNNPAFYLAIMESFLNFPLIPRIRSAERIHRIGGNF